MIQPIALMKKMSDDDDLAVGSRTLQEGVYVTEKKCSVVMNEAVVLGEQNHDDVSALVLVLGCSLQSLDGLAHLRALLVVRACWPVLFLREEWCNVDELHHASRDNMCTHFVQPGFRR